MFKHNLLFIAITLIGLNSWAQSQQKKIVAEKNLYSIHSVFASNSSRVEIKLVNDQHTLIVKPSHTKFKTIKLTAVEFLDLKKMLSQIDKNQAHNKSFCNRFWVEIKYLETGTSKVFCSRSKTKPTKLTKQLLSEIEYLYKKN